MRTDSGHFKHGVNRPRAAAAGGQVRVATAGPYAINQTITSPQFDRRAAMPPGTKGSLMGPQVVLEGMRA